MSGIPFNRVPTLGREAAYVGEVLESGRIGGGGIFTRRCETRLEDILDAGTVLLTNSCTSALEMAALLLDLKEGDEVIMPSFTFVSTANAVCLRGARPRFVDICPDTLNLNPAAIEAAITGRTRAILPVHYAGQLCDMASISTIAARHGLSVVEDAAQALGSTRDGKGPGALSRLAAFSFHETKNVSCGEGGALLVGDPDLVPRARIIRDKGTNRDAFQRGIVDKYSWVDLGSSYAISDLLAAFLLGQLERVHDITAARRALCERYAALLAPLADRGLVRLPVEAPGSCGNGHIFHLILPTAALRDAFIDHMRKAGIQAIFHYVPLHTSSMGKRLGHAREGLPVTEDLAARLVRLPLHAALAEEDLRRVVAEVFRFFALSPP